MTTYVTFGQVHKHEINGILYDKDCVAVIKSNTRSEGRIKAFEDFGLKFCFEYFNDEFNYNDMIFFPRGFIDVE